VVVIGGGAAGFFAAITCAQTHPHSQVTLLEAGPHPLSKVRISGGGRCNVTHACFEPALLVQHYPRGGKALRGAFSRFQPRDTVQWFAQRGVALKTEADGRMFPLTDNSDTIVECLLSQAHHAGVRLRRRAAVTALEKSAQGFEVRLKSGEILQADRVLIATGSSPLGYSVAQHFGHTVVSPVPSLFTFTLKDPRLQDLAGISVNPVRLRLQVDASKLEQTGPVLITHWGLSGPAVLKLSAWGARLLHRAKYQASLTVNWLPNSNAEVLRQELLAVKAQLPQRAIATSCPVMLPRRLWQHLVQHVGIAETLRWTELSNKRLNQLIQELVQGQYQILGKGEFKEEFVTCGGVNVKEVDCRTMASRLCPGLYFAGEVLDIDGVTGGFNFQSAWTTGWLAGQALGRVD
jgi:hypothetical protein